MENSTKIHVVGWKKMMIPKNQGEMVMCDLKAMNQACLMKLGLSYRMEDESLWIHVLRGKYGRNNLSSNALIVKVLNSQLLKEFAKLWPVMNADRKSVV